MARTIRDKLEEVEIRLADVQEAITNYESQLQEKRMERERLSAQIAVLKEVLPDEEPEVVVPQNGALNPAPPSEVILKLLATADEPMSMLEIIDAVEDKVKSSAKNVRHNLRTTLFNLTKRGQITRHDDNSYSLRKP